MPTQTANQNTPLGFDPKYLDPANNPFLNDPRAQLPSTDDTSSNPLASLPPYDPSLQQAQPTVLPTVAPQILPAVEDVPTPTFNQVPDQTQVLPPINTPSVDTNTNPFLQGQMAPLTDNVPTQNVVAQTLPPLPNVNTQNPQLDPSILASSFQQFPKEDRPVQISTGANPEVSANRPLEATTEQAQEKILEELRNIESSPDAKTEQKAPETPKEEDNKLDESKDHSAKTTGAIGNITVYGYKIPQKVINLGDKLIAMKGIGDVNSAKTWLYALVGRVIEMKTTKHEKDKD
jgi:hypothetical protein